MAVLIFNQFIAFDKIRHEPQTSVAFVVQIFKNRTSPPGRLRAANPAPAHWQCSAPPKARRTHNGQPAPRLD
jgi:hypothetical protein